MGICRWEVGREGWSILNSWQPQVVCLLPLRVHCLGASLQRSRSLPLHSSSYDHCRGGWGWRCGYITVGGVRVWFHTHLLGLSSWILYFSSFFSTALRSSDSGNLVAMTISSIPVVMEMS